MGTEGPAMGIGIENGLEVLGNDSMIINGLRR